MSFSFTVPAGPADAFPAAAAKAKADNQAAAENNDYAMTQLASETCDAAIKAASDLVAALGDGTVNQASIVGHHSTDGVTASSVSVSVSVIPAPKPAETAAPVTETATTDPAPSA